MVSLGTVPVMLFPESRNRLRFIKERMGARNYSDAVDRLVSVYEIHVGVDKR